MAYDRELALAREAAMAAGGNALRIRAAGLSPKIKPDGSPVTAADLDNERLLRGLIEEAFPHDGILGEEGTRKPGDSGRRWILDPIDGTRDFVRGDPAWCVLIALEDGGEPVVGVAHFPMLDETYWASRGQGAYRNGEPFTLSDPLPKETVDFLSHLWIVRGFGQPPVQSPAREDGDVWFERRGELWDLAPVQVIIEEAGGRYFAPDGSRRNNAGRAFACTPALEPRVKAFLGLA